MLILTRKPGESLYIGDNVKITIVEIKGNQIRVGIDAPAELRIYREEIYLQILEENRSAADVNAPASALDQLSGSWKGGAPKSMQLGRQAEHKMLRTNKSSGSEKVGSSGISPVEPRVFVKRKKRDDGETPPDSEGGEK